MHLTHNPSPITHHLAEKHTFSSKERDVETGLSYFGARYYSSDLSIWLSVDPMSDKYPSMSPYVYCANNPVKLVDPNGEEIGDFFDENGVFWGSDGKDDGNIYIISQEVWDRYAECDKIRMTISQKKPGSYLDNYFDIKSAFDNERGHINQFRSIGGDAYCALTGSQRESFALDYQQSQPIYVNTSKYFKAQTNNYKLQNK